MSGAHFADCWAMIEPLADDMVVARSSATLSRHLLDGVLVLAPEMSEPLRVTTPGEVLWAMLAERCTVAELVEVWSALYKISTNAARADIEPVLVAWLAGGAISADRHLQ